MTREEEINQKAISEQRGLMESYDWRGGFISGAKWADEHPNLYNDEKYHTVKVSCLDELYRKSGLFDTFMEKACEYIRTHLWTNVDDDKNPIIESVQNITLDNFIKNFKKYLDE